MLSQYDSSDFRRNRLSYWRSRYHFKKNGQIPVNADPTILDSMIDLLWDASISKSTFKIRSNIEKVLEKTGWTFSKTIPSLTTRDFAEYLIKMDLPKLTEYFIPDLGFSLDGGRPRHIDDYRKVFANGTVPEIASRYMTDESFAHAFVAGANPLVIRRLDTLLPHFPINQDHFKQSEFFHEDHLTTAMEEKRVYIADFNTLSILRNGQHYQNKKYVYQPLCAFAVPKTGGLMRAFAIQVGQDSATSEIYTPADGWSWQIAKSMVMVAYGNHHEAVTHLAETHLVMEPIVVATYRQLSHRHPLYALLFNHGEGTLQINNLAFAWLLQPGKPFDVITGSTLDDIYKLATTARLEFDFRANYLPQKLKNQGLTDDQALPYYPYRDDALLLWNAIKLWVDDFLACYYLSDDDVRMDSELQNWAQEIASPEGGHIKNFIVDQAGITSIKELSGLITMILFTAGPQHAAVNFPQKSDMAYVPATPLAGYIPEIKGRSHEETDYLNFLPPMEVACTTQMTLDFLGDIYFNKLGDYGRTFDFDSEKVKVAIQGFQKRLEAIETILIDRDRDRLFSYPHLRPSRIPKSINI